MTTGSRPTDLSAPEQATRVGAAAVQRFRLPGRSSGRERPAPIGSLARSSVRFAAATLQPVAIRRMLSGPGVASAPSIRTAQVRPPRWWTPEPPPAPSLVARPPAAALPRAARRIPNEQTWSPGGIADSLVAQVARVRRLEEVQAVGPMVSQHERSRLGPTGSTRSRPPRLAGAGAARTTSARRSFSGRVPATDVGSAAPSRPPPAPSATMYSSPGAGAASPARAGSGGTSANAGPVASAGGVALLASRFAALRQISDPPVTRSGRTTFGQNRAAPPSSPAGSPSSLAATATTQTSPTVVSPSLMETVAKMFRAGGSDQARPTAGATARNVAPARPMSAPAAVSTTTPSTPATPTSTPTSTTSTMTPNTPVESTTTARTPTPSPTAADSRTTSGSKATSPTANPPTVPTFLGRRASAGSVETIARSATLHPPAATHGLASTQAGRALGRRAGLALSPATTRSALRRVLPVGDDSPVRPAKRSFPPGPPLGPGLPLSVVPGWAIGAPRVLAPASTHPVVHRASPANASEARSRPLPRPSSVGPESVTDGGTTADGASTAGRAIAGAGPAAGQAVTGGGVAAGDAPPAGPSGGLGRPGSWRPTELARRRMLMPPAPPPGAETVARVRLVTGEQVADARSWSPGRVGSPVRPAQRVRAPGHRRGHGLPVSVAALPAIAAHGVLPTPAVPRASGARTNVARANVAGTNVARASVLGPGRVGAALMTVAAARPSTSRAGTPATVGRRTGGFTVPRAHAPIPQVRGLTPAPTSTSSIGTAARVSAAPLETAHRDGALTRTFERVDVIRPATTALVGSAISELAALYGRAPAATTVSASIVSSPAALAHPNPRITRSAAEPGSGTVSRPALDDVVIRSAEVLPPADRTSARYDGAIGVPPVPQLGWFHDHADTPPRPAAGASNGPGRGVPAPTGAAVTAPGVFAPPLIDLRRFPSRPGGPAPGRPVHGRPVPGRVAPSPAGAPPAHKAFTSIEGPSAPGYAPPAVPTRHGSGSNDSVRRSLIDSWTVFRPTDGGPPSPDRSATVSRYVVNPSGGRTVNDDLSTLVGGGSYDGDARPIDLPDSSHARRLDELVDLVIDRIEQRVIDELERRGRWLNSDGF